MMPRTAVGRPPPDAGLPAPSAMSMATAIVAARNEEGVRVEAPMIHGFDRDEAFWPPVVAIVARQS